MNISARRAGGQRLPGLALLLALSLFSLCPAGCATVGRDFPTTRVNEIQQGRTSQNEIREIFGPPWRVGMENGQTTWTYGKYRYGLGGKEAQDLLIRFDSLGLVDTYTFSSTKHAD